MRRQKASPAGPAKVNPGDEVRPGTVQSGETVCPACGGSGRLGEDKCPSCAGTGIIVALVGDA
jgi:DnaJ-class molecular chaperone